MELPPIRLQSKPRCRRCRTDKKKCEPSTESSEYRCQRCVEKNFDTCVSENTYRWPPGSTYTPGNTQPVRSYRPNSTSTAYSQVGAQQQYQTNNIRNQMDSIPILPNRLPADRIHHTQSTVGQLEQRPYDCFDNNRIPFSESYEPDRALLQFSDGCDDLSPWQHDAVGVDQSEPGSREPRQDQLRNRGGH